MLHSCSAFRFLPLQLSDQRRRGVLTQQQIEHVSACLAGWSWDARVKAPPLNEMIALLQDFVQQHGRLPRQYEVSAERRLAHRNAAVGTPRCRWPKDRGSLQQS
jgi:hypothetical protein